MGHNKGLEKVTRTEKGGRPTEGGHRKRRTARTDSTTPIPPSEDPSQPALKGPPHDKRGTNTRRSEGERVTTTLK